MATVFVNPVTGKVRTGQRRRKGTLPLWVTPERQAVMAKILYSEKSNQCLQGHAVCPIQAHYVMVEEQITTRLVRSNSDETALLTDDWEVLLNSRGTKRVPYYGVKEVKAPWLDPATGLARKDKFRMVWVTTGVEIAQVAFTTKPSLDIMEETIERWKREDGEDRAAAWEREKNFLHRAEKGSFGSTFDPVARDVFMETQPRYYLNGYTVTPMNDNMPLAKIRIASTGVILFVDVRAAFVGVSKNKRRKFARYGKGVPVEAQTSVDYLCNKAVDGWWAK